MAASNRSALLTKTHKVLKKHYKPVAPAADRPLLEQMLFACCLENASYQAAETAYAKLTESFFDLNEVRVSSIGELAETMRELPDARSAALRIKKVLQGVFEAAYSFDLEPLKKQNIGVAVKRLQKLTGVSAFVISYTNQTALGGHSIPVDDGALAVLAVLGVITPEEAVQQLVPGMERAIPKSKGIEFGSLLHQLGVDYLASPFSPAVRQLLLSIDPKCKERLPKRRGKKPADEKEAARDETQQAVPPKADDKPKDAEPKKTPPTKKKTAAKSAPKKTTTRKKTAAAGKTKPAAVKKKTPGKQLARRKPR